MLMGVDRRDFTFEGNKLGELLEAVFAGYDLRDLIFDEEGNIKTWARVAINGRFSYTIEDMNAAIQEGDLKALLHSYVVAF